MQSLESGIQQGRPDRQDGQNRLRGLSDTSASSVGMIETNPVCGQQGSGKRQGLVGEADAHDAEQEYQMWGYDKHLFTPFSHQIKAEFLLATLHSVTDWPGYRHPGRP